VPVARENALCESQYVERSGVLLVEDGTAKLRGALLAQDVADMRETAAVRADVREDARPTIMTHTFLMMKWRYYEAWTLP
jgi:hypothetical protein